jgi:carboxylesterase
MLPTGTLLKVYKSKQDPVADPVSAVLIYEGVKNAAGQATDVQLINSKLHVYTRLRLRSDVTMADQQNQTATFADIVNRALR